MSLHFQIDIAFDFKEDCPIDIIHVLINLSNKRNLTEEQRLCIPKILESEIRGMSDSLSFLGRSIFYFQKHYRYTENGNDIHKWTFHFRTVFSDDVLYENGYRLLAWLSFYSDTNGFVGYIKEEYDRDPRLLYFDNGEVIIKSDSEKEIKYKYSDFDLK